MGIRASLGRAANRWHAPQLRSRRCTVRIGRATAARDAVSQIALGGRDSWGAGREQTGTSRPVQVVTGGGRGECRPTGCGRGGSWGDPSLGTQAGDDAHGASTADRTASRGGFRHAGSRCFAVLGRQECRGRDGRNRRELATAGQLLLAGTIGQQPEVAIVLYE
jgi:hypothetical protein